jgi:hypothetical protein
MTSAGPALVAFRHAPDLGLDVETAPSVGFDAPCGAVGVTGMSSSNCYIASGCPLSVVD